MSTFWKMGGGEAKDAASTVPEDTPLSPEDAESILNELAGTYSKERDIAASLGAVHHFFERLDQTPISETQLPNLEAKYRALVEQLPAVVFMAYLDRGRRGICEPADRSSAGILAGGMAGGSGAVVPAGPS